MINHIAGLLVEVHEDTVVVERAGIGYVVSIPKYAVGELAACCGREAKLHTLLFIEGNQTGGHLQPVLVGFPHAEDKLFFRRFVSVKGIGWRKALKALAEPTGQVAAWIEQGNVAALKRLPGIGSRSAELIVAELKGKMQDMAIATSGWRPVDSTRFSESQRDALEVMVSIGDGRAEAEQWLERVGQLHGDQESADEWLRAAYRIKTGVEG